MARANWTNHPTAYRVHVIITATDPISKESLQADEFYGPYGTKGGAKGQSSRHANHRRSYGAVGRWHIRGQWIDVPDWKVEGVVEQLAGYGTWEEVS